MTNKERGLWNPRDGFPAVAAFVARDPDQETFIFRKFKLLTARTLLHLQSELVNLEQQLASLDREIAESTDRDLRRSLRNWEYFRANVPKRPDLESRQKLFDDIENKLSRYHELLLRESQIAKLEEPSKRVYKEYLDDLKGEKDRSGPKLGGHSEDILAHEKDLVALKPPQNKDLLSKFLLNHWLFSTKDLLEGSSDDEVAQAVYFRERTLVLVVNVVSTMTSGLLLIGSILALYFVTDPNGRLGLVIMFIILFAIGLGLMTSASRDAMFAGTAAYAAVLVVFVSGNLKIPGGT